MKYLFSLIVLLWVAINANAQTSILSQIRVKGNLYLEKLNPGDTFKVLIVKETGIVDTIDASYFMSGEGVPIIVKNGLYKSGDTIKIGNELTEPTMIDINKNIFTLVNPNYLNNSNDTLSPLLFIGFDSRGKGAAGIGIGPFDGKADSSSIIIFGNSPDYSLGGLRPTQISFLSADGDYIFGSVPIGDELNYVYGEDEDGYLTKININDIGGVGDYIPLSGTEFNKPVTGTISFDWDSIETGANARIDYDEGFVINRNVSGTNLGTAQIQGGSLSINTQTDSNTLNVSLGITPLDSALVLYTTYQTPSNPPSTSLIGFKGYNVYDIRDSTYFIQKYHLDSAINSVSSGGSPTASNGLQIMGDGSVGLGGDLDEDVVVNAGEHSFKLSGNGGHLHFNSRDTSLFEIDLYGFTSNDTLTGIKSMLGLGDVASFLPGIKFPISAITKGNIVDFMNDDDMSPLDVEPGSFLVGNITSGEEHPDIEGDTIYTIQNMVVNKTTDGNTLLMNIKDQNNIGEQTEIIQKISLIGDPMEKSQKSIESNTIHSLTTITDNIDDFLNSNFKQSRVQQDLDNIFLSYLTNNTSTNVGTQSYTLFGAGFIDMTALYNNIGHKFNITSHEIKFETVNVIPPRFSLFSSFIVDNDSMYINSPKIEYRGSVSNDYYYYHGTNLIITDFNYDTWYFDINMDNYPPDYEDVYITLPQNPRRGLVTTIIIGHGTTFGMTVTDSVTWDFNGATPVFDVPTELKSGDVFKLMYIYEENSWVKIN